MACVSDDLVVAARRAAELIESDARAASAAAVAVLDRALAAGDSAAASAAERVLGLAAAQTDGMSAAIAHFQRAVQLAGQSGDALLRTEARISLSGVLIQQGRAREALRVVNECIDGSSGLARARARAKPLDLSLIHISEP